MSEVFLVSFPQETRLQKTPERVFGKAESPEANRAMKTWLIDVRKIWEVEESEEGAVTMRFDQEEVSGGCGGSFRRRRYILKGCQVEREKEMDKIEFVFTWVQRRWWQDQCWGCGWASTVKKWYSKLKGKVTDTVGRRNQRLVRGWKGRDELAGRRRLERPAWQVERRDQASRLEMKEGYHNRLIFFLLWRNC